MHPYCSIPQVLAHGTKTPTQWKESHVRMLYKAGDVSDVDNYRGISLLAVASKIYERVIYDRLQEQLVHRGALPAELFGFMSKHSQTHALYSSYEAIKHSRRTGKCVCVCSADVKKAYPSMLRAQMLSDLKGFGVSAGLFHAVASMYQHNTSRILTSDAGITSSSYPVENGLREGAVLSPLLYCVFTAGLIAKLKAPDNVSHGMHVGTEWTGAQLWADDLLLMTSHENADTAKEQMTHLMKVLIADADEKHYSYSACKTKVLVIDGTAATFDSDKKFVPSTTDWPLGTEVPSFKFLGTVLDKQLKWDEHIAHRESAMMDALYYVRQLASHKILKIKYTTREWERSCGQSLFYGAEALGLHTKSSWQQLNKQIARGAAIALDLHATVTPEMAANDLQWHNAEYRVQLAQMRLLWDLQHNAPRKARRVYRATMSSTEPIRRKAAASAPWHCAAHELQQQIEEAHPISITTSTKKQWLTSAATFLATKYASFWHDLLEARTTPPAPPTAPTRTGLRPRPNAPLPPPARVLAPKDFVREVVSMPVGDALHVGQVVSYDAGLRQWQIDFPTLSATPTNFGADDMARYGPPNTTCPSLP